MQTNYRYSVSLAVMFPWLRFVFSGPFQECHAVVAPAEYFEDCVYDTCLFIMNDLNTQDVKCDSFQDYAEACRDAGVAIDWFDNTNTFLDRQNTFIYLYSA